MYVYIYGCLLLLFLYTQKGSACSLHFKTFSFQLYPAIASLGHCVHATGHIILSYFFLSSSQYLVNLISTLSTRHCITVFCSIYCQQTYLPLPNIINYYRILDFAIIHLAPGHSLLTCF